MWREFKKSQWNGLNKLYVTVTPLCVKTRDEGVKKAGITSHTLEQTRGYVSSVDYDFLQVLRE